MIEIKKRYTGEAINSGDFESVKDCLLDAIKNEANLYDADLRGANLYGADLRDADLCGANLYGADLYGADLWGANLRGCAGNNNQIKSLWVSEIYQITYTSEYLQIGCERHKISDWWSFDDKIIIEMEGKKALSFWRENKEFIRMVVEKYPAVKTGKEKD